MTLIYRPSNIYMTPNNVAVDMNDNLQCSFIFNGYKLRKATYDLYNNLGSGKWNKIYSDMDMILTKTYYNNDVVEFTSFEDLTNYYNSRCGWAVNVFGAEYNIVADTQTPTNSTFPLNVNGLESGDEVWLKNKYDRLFVNQGLIIDLKNESYGKYLDGVIYCGERGLSIANDYTDYFNIIAKRNNNDNIIFKANRWYKVKFSYNSFNGSVKNPNPDAGYDAYMEMNIDAFFVTAPAQKILLESSLLNSNHIYEYIFKYNVDILDSDILGEKNLFSFTFKNKSFPTDGLTWIPPGAAIATFTLWDSEYTNMAYVNYENKRVNFHGNKEGALQNAQGDLIPYDWIGTGNSLTPHASSQIVPFVPFVPSVMKLEVPEILDVFNYKFKPTWTGVEPIINQWQAVLFFENGEIIEESPHIYNSNMEYVFFNQFLNGEKYYVHFHAYDNNGYYYHIQSNVFAIEYEVVDIKYNPIATNDCNDSSVNIKWDGIKVVNNDVFGSISYVENFGTQDNYGLKLEANSSVGYNLDIPLITFPSFYWSPIDDTFEGSIMTMSNDEDGELTVLYNKTSKKFEMKVTNAIDVYIETIIEMNRDITTNDIFLIGFYSDAAIPYVRLVPSTINKNNESGVSE